MEPLKKLWQPTEAFAQSSEMFRFMTWLKEEKNVAHENYDELWQWSVDNIEDFWQCVWEFYEVEFDGEIEEVLTTHDMPGARWFTGTSVNYAEHIFRKSTDERPALLHSTEDGIIHEMSWSELENRVKALQAHLISAGVKKGDRVVGYLSNTPDATIAFLATCSLGAVWSQCSPEFGTHSVVNRFAQIEPVVLIGVNGYSYNGKPFDRSAELAQIANDLPTLREIILIDAGGPNLPGSVETPTTNWDTIISNEISGPLNFTRVPFNDPIWVLYSSGTTGIPKAITHSQGGILIEHFKLMGLHSNVKAGDRYFWYSTTGWMMWNVVQASLLMGATAILYEGSLAYPSLNKLWDLAEQTKMTNLGVSAGFIHACMKNKLKPRETHDLTHLLSIGSTGSVLTRPGFEWVYSDVKPEVWLVSLSGGSDVCSAFIGGNPMLPVYAGTLQCRYLGSSIFAFDHDGNALTNEPGELVITEPAPSMPIYFWGDEDDKRYKSSYFELFPNIWRHGDRIIIYENGSVEMLGRSDSTLNRMGVRIGTSEIYQLAEKNPLVTDSLVVNIERDEGDFMPLFVVLKAGAELTDELKSEIKRTIKTEASPRHIPNDIIQVEEIPYTMSGKKMEIPVKRILKGGDIEKVLNKDSMKNPKCIEFFIEYGKQLKLA